MNLALTVRVVLMAVLCCLLCSCSGSPSSKTGPSSSTPASAANNSAQPESPAATIDPCSKFSAADAQAIMGVPMKLSRGQGAIVCMYEEASPQTPSTSAKVTLVLNVRKSVDEANRTW